jgi:multiple sugar transport system permease protein
MRDRLRRNLTSYVMLVPFLGLFAGFLVWPLANSLYLSFTNFNGVNLPEFTGLQNFQRLLFDDDRFRHALMNTFVYVVASVGLGTLFSLALALAFRVELVPPHHADDFLPAVGDLLHRPHAALEVDFQPG